MLRLSRDQRPSALREPPNRLLLMSNRSSQPICDRDGLPSRDRVRESCVLPALRRCWARQGPWSARTAV